jgi:hypothetical protein
MSWASRLSGRPLKKLILTNRIKERKMIDITSFISGALTYHSMLWVGHALLRIWELRKG